MDGFQAIQRTIREDADFQHLPPFLDKAIELFSKAHIYYSTFKLIEILDKSSKDSSEGNSAIYGAALHLVGDYTSIGSYALNVALAIKCTEDLLREYRHINGSYQTFCHAVKWQYPIYHSIEWKQNTKDEHAQSVLPPSFYLLRQVQIMGFTKQILKIIQCALDVFWQAFKLSMSLCDAYLLLNGDSRARYEGCTELIADWSKYKKQLKEDQTRLLEEIEKGCGLADRILNHIGATKDSSFVIAGLKQKIEKLAENAGEVVEDLHDVAEGTLDTIYTPGKITPLRINLAVVKKAIPPALPRGRFPPWGGDQVVLSDLKNLTDSSQSSGSNFLSSIESSVNGLIDLAGSLKKIYQEQFTQ